MRKSSPRYVYSLLLKLLTHGAFLFLLEFIANFPMMIKAIVQSHLGIFISTVYKHLTILFKHSYLQCTTILSSSSNIHTCSLQSLDYTLQTSIPAVYNHSTILPNIHTYLQSTTHYSLFSFSFSSPHKTQCLQTIFKV